MDTKVRTAKPASEDRLAGLIGQIALKHEPAMAELYDRTRLVVYGLALRILRDRFAAEDVTQEIYMQIWRKADTFDGARACAMTWIVVMSRSRALDKLRSAKAFLCQDSDSEQLDILLSTDPDPEHHSSRSERARLVRRFLYELPLEQRQAIEMAFFDGYTHSEIAQQTALPIGTIKSRIRTGMKRLREQLSILDGYETSCERREEGAAAGIGLVPGG